MTEAIELLELYAVQAAELNASSFLKAIREGPSTTFQFEPGQFRATRNGGPSADAMKAFVLAFRLFIQEKDGLSFRRMAQLYPNLPVSASLVAEAGKITQQVNAFLQGPSPFVILGESIDRHTLLSVWLYGRLAHVNKDKREVLQRWQVDEDIAPLFQHEFESIIVGLTQAVFWMRQVHLRALDELRRGSGASKLADA